MHHSLTRLTAGLLIALGYAVPATAQFGHTFATPLPPGPGTVPFIPNGRMVAPVLMPLCAPTAAPVAVYNYGPTAPAGTDCGPVESCDDTARSRGRFWASADFLYGATQGVWVPPLVSMAAPGSPPPTAGAPGSPSPIVFGGRREMHSTRPGLQARAGYWFDPAGTRGVDASFFFLGGLSERFTGFSGPGGVVLARPIIGPEGTGVGAPVAGEFPGSITASVDTRILGGDVNYRRALSRGECCRLDLLVGYRYLHLGDTVDVWSATRSQAANLDLGPVQVLLHDSFRTRNHFHGPQVGFVAGCKLSSGLALELVTKLAMGVTVSEANTVGSSQVTANPGVGNLSSGLLVLRSNSVADTTNYFAVVPEVGFKAGYCLTDCLKLNAGYTFLYWSQVRRASEQIDLTINPAIGRPAFRNDTSDVWVQGWTLGVELQY